MHTEQKKIQSVQCNTKQNRASKAKTVSCRCDGKWACTRWHEGGPVTN